MFQMIQNTDSSLKRQLDLKTHQKKLQQFSRRQTAVDRAKHVEKVAKNIVWNSNLSSPKPKTRVSLDQNPYNLQPEWRGQEIFSIN